MMGENVEEFLDQVKYTLRLAKWPAKKQGATYILNAILNLLDKIKNYNIISDEDQEWWDQQERSNNESNRGQ